MSTNDNQIPVHLLNNIDRSLTQLTEAAKYQTAATLAAGIIAASGRPHSIEEAIALAHNIHFAIHPAPGYGRYEAWAKTKDATLKEIHK